MPLNWGRVLSLVVTQFLISYLDRLIRFQALSWCQVSRAGCLWPRSSILFLLSSLLLTGCTFSTPSSKLTPCMPLHARSYESLIGIVCLVGPDTLLGTLAAHDLRIILITFLSVPQVSAVKSPGILWYSWSNKSGDRDFWQLPSYFSTLDLTRCGSGLCYNSPCKFQYTWSQGSTFVW